MANDPILQSAQQVVESGSAPILGDDGKVVVQDIQQGGTFGQIITDDQGTYVEYFEPYEPPELELTEGVPLTGTAAMSAQADPRRGEDNFVTKKVYLYPTQEFANTYNNLQPEEREALIRSDEDFRTKTWNFSALNQYNQVGLSSQGQWELSLGGFDVDVATARQAVENVSKKSYEKIAQADATLQRVAPEQYQRLAEIEDELFELESIDELAKDGSYYNTKKFELESEYKRILQTPIETEQGVVPLGNLDAWRQRLYSEQDRTNIQNSFWKVYEGSDEQRRQQFYQAEVEKAADDLQNWYEKAGAAGYYANLGLRKIARATMDVAANAVGIFAMTPLADLVGSPEARDWAENMAIDLSIAARAVQGDANTGSMNRYEYALDDNRTAVVDAEGQLLSIENINGFNLMRNMSSREIDRIQQQIISDRNRIYEDSSWGRLGSEVVDVGLDMGPILMGAGGIGRFATSTVLKTTGKEMLEKGTKMALFQGASAASAFINTLGRNYTSALEQGLSRENATKLALTQSAIEGLAMSVVGGIEARTAAVLSGSVRNQVANAIRGYMSGYYSLDGVAKRLGKVGIQAGKDVIAEAVEENFVEWSQGLAATSYGLEGSYTAQDASNITATTIGLTLLMGGGLGTYRHQFRESRQAPTLDEMGQWRAQLVDKVMTNMDSVEKLAKTVGANAGLTPEQVNQKVLQLRHAKQQYDALPPDMSLEERSEYISNVIEIETIKESLPNLNEDQILWEKHLSVLERRNREILGVPQESSPVSDEISERADELASENEISAPQDVEVLPSPYGQVEERADESAVEQTSEQPEAEQPAVEDQYVSRNIGGETIFYRVGENGLLSIVNEVPEGASVLTQEEFDAQQGQESVQEDEIIEGEVPVTEEEPAVDQPSDLPIDRADDLSQPEAIEQPTEVQEEAESEVEQPTQAIPERSERGEAITIQIPEKEGVIRPTSAEVVRVGNELKQINPNGIVEDIPPYRIDEYTSIYNEQVPETERIFDQETPSQPTEDTISEQEGDSTVEEQTTTTEPQEPTSSSYVSNTGKEIQVQRAEDGNWYRVKKDGSLYKNPISNTDYLNQIEENVPEQVNWRQGFDDPRYENLRDSILKSVANVKSNPQELSDVLDRLDAMVDRGETMRTDIYYDVSRNPGANEEIRQRALKKVEELTRPTSETQQNEEQVVSTEENIIDEQGNINYGEVEEISDGIEQGGQTVGELSVQEEKGRVKGGRTNVEASVVLRGDRQANQAQYSGEPETIAERQEALLEQYAKEKGVWLDESEIEESSSRRLPSGQEASVWLNEDKATVTKAIDYSVYSENLEEFLNDRIALYNHLFPDTALQVVGFTKTDGKFKVVVSQPLIQGQMLAPEGQTKIPADEQQLLDEYMADTFGMERRGTTYFNSDYVIDDVHGGNVIKSDGKYYFIDVVPSLNEPIDDLGGNRQYRVEPDVVEEQATPDVETAPESLSEIGRKSKQLKGQERIDALVEDAPALLEDNVTARQVFEAVDKKIPLNQIEDILAEAALTAEGQPKTATSNNISKVAKALGIGTKSKIKEGGKVVNVIKDKNGNWKRVDKKGNIIDAPLTREQIAEANSNTSNLFQISDIDMLIEHGLIEKKDC